MDDDTFNKKPKFRVIDGRMTTETRLANELVHELSTKTIPELHATRQSLQNLQLILGLKRDPSDIYRKRFIYPEPLKANSALKLAVDMVGGENFIQERKTVDRLDELEQKTAKALHDLNNKSNGLKAFRSVEQSKKFTLNQDLIKRRETLNQAVIRYNAQVEILNRPENQARILQVAESLLKNDVKVQIKRLKLENELNDLGNTLKKAYSFEKQYKELGNTKVLVNRVELKVGKKSFSIPTPSNELTFEKQLEQAKQKTLMVARGLKK